MAEKAYTSENDHPRLEQLEDEVVIRHQYKRGEQAGETVEAKIRDGHIIYNNEKLSPSGAARNTFSGSQILPTTSLLIVWLDDSTV